MKVKNECMKAMAIAFVALAAALTTMPVLGETINMDFGYGSNYWLQADGWNRASLDSAKWGFVNSLTPWTNNLINSEGELTGVRLQVTQRATTWRENTSPYVLTGDALTLFGTQAAGKAANLFNETALTKFAFLGLDTNKFYKFTVFCSKKSTGTVTNGFILNSGHSSSNSVLNMVPYAAGVANTSAVYSLTNQPYYVASHYAGDLGNISTTVLKFEFLRIGTVGVGALNGLILEELLPPPPPPPLGTVVTIL